MKGASDAIKRSFQNAGNEMEELAHRLEEEVDSLARLSSYINITETEKIADTLAEALNIQNLLNDQRTELSGLAKQTISKCERIVRKFEETVAKERELDSGMRSILRDMRSLLSFSEKKLVEARDTIKELGEKINKVMASLRVFKGMILRAKDMEERLSANKTVTDAQDIIRNIKEGIVNGVDGYSKAEEGDGTKRVLESILGPITKLSLSLVKVVNRPDIGPKLDSALNNVNDAIKIVKKQSSEMEKERVAISKWRDAVEDVKNDVFQGDLRGTEEEFLFEEIQGIIEDGDVAEIYEAFNGLKDAAQNYLSVIKISCPLCAQ